MANRLCDKCIQNAEREDLFPDRVWTAHDIAAAAQHCPYCAVLWKSVNTIFANNATIGSMERCDEDKIRVWEPFGVEGGSSARRSVSYEFVTCQKMIELSVFRTHQQHDIPSDLDGMTRFLHRRIPIRFAIPCSTGSSEAISQTRLWILNCLQNHQPACRPLSHDTSFPRRLVRVRKSMGEYIVNVVEPDTHMEYFCLSHRWGAGPAPCTTKTENITERKKRIPWGGLPNLFRQALEFTHALGVEYLWIDSLCIIQDSDDDWSNESKKMASIYGNSTLTLAASVAANSDGELYGTPSPTETGVLVEGLQALGVTDKIFVREMLEHRMELFPLLKRAWAYQERLLSPRYLHFSPVELIWECNSQTVCMCSGRDIESERGLGEKTHGRFAKKNFWHCLGWNEREKYFKIKEEWRSFAWNTVVEQYSSLNITYRRDRLPAISGMAKQFRYLGQRGEYLAGLWRDTFLENMMWRASARSASMPKASEWVAPTWSWCSVGAGVTYFGQPWVALEISDRISLLGATCEHLYEDNTLNLKSASITLHGPAFNATVQYTSNAHGCKTYALVIEGVKPGKFLVDYDISAPGDGHLPCGSELLCLEAGNVTIYGEDGFGMHALVFRKLPDGRFERVGLVEWAEDIRGAANQAETTILTVV